MYVYLQEHFFNPHTAVLHTYLCLSPAVVSENKVEAELEQRARLGTRALFKDKSSCYIMDAKSMGNIGRYLNVRVNDAMIEQRSLLFPFSCLEIKPCGYVVLPFSTNEDCFGAVPKVTKCMKGGNFLTVWVAEPKRAISR